MEGLKHEQVSKELHIANYRYLIAKKGIDNSWSMTYM